MEMKLLAEDHKYNSYGTRIQFSSIQKTLFVTMWQLKAHIIMYNTVTHACVSVEGMKDMIEVDNDPGYEG